MFVFVVPDKQTHTKSMRIPCNNSKQTFHFKHSLKVKCKRGLTSIIKKYVISTFNYLGDRDFVADVSSDSSVARRETPETLDRLDVQVLVNYQHGFVPELSWGQRTTTVTQSIRETKHLTIELRQLNNLYS